MGKCSVCGEKILYNAFKRIKGIIYCLKCVPKEAAVTVMFDEALDVDFSELAEELAKVPGTFVTDKKICKYCGAKNSSEWKYLPLTNEWCCKKRACRKKTREE